MFSNMYPAAETTKNPTNPKEKEVLPTKEPTPATRTITETMTTMTTTMRRTQPPTNSRIQEGTTVRNRTGIQIELVMEEPTSPGTTRRLWLMMATQTNHKELTSRAHTIRATLNQNSLLIQGEELTTEEEELLQMEDIVNTKFKFNLQEAGEGLLIFTPRIR